MDPKITEEIKEQEDALDQSIALNKITVMLLDERKKELKKIWVFFSVVCAAFVALFAVFAYTTHKEKQELMAQLNDTRVDFMEYLDSIEYTVTDDYSTDTTQTVEGDSATINNVDGDQYNDNAVRAENYKNTCEITTAIHAEGEATRALINANTMQDLRDKLADRDRELQTANFHLSQQAQNATLISTLRPFPQPAYITCSPYTAMNGYGACNGCNC